MVPVVAYRMPGGGSSPVADACWVVDERPLFLDVEGVGAYTLMWTDTDPARGAAGYTAEDGALGDGPLPEALSLAVGFAFTEGLIDSLDDIRSIAVCADAADVVRMRLRDPSHACVRRRNAMVLSSCGICGDADGMKGLLSASAPVSRHLRLDAYALQTLVQGMEQRQPVFRRTGGSHAAAIFSADGHILAAAEDLGRHNALDKVIGRCLLSGMATAGCGAVLSSRLSLEMINKAARAGLEVVAAISAPSSLAIAVAERLGITLCGFVRGGEINVYTHPQRLCPGTENNSKKK